MAKSVIYVDTAAKFGDYLSSMGKRGRGKMTIENEKKLALRMNPYIPDDVWKALLKVREKQNKS